MFRTIANYALGLGVLVLVGLVGLLYWDQRGLSGQVVKLNQAIGKQNTAIEKLPVEAARLSAEAATDALRAMREVDRHRPAAGAANTPEELNRWLAELFR